MEPAGQSHGHRRRRRRRKNKGGTAAAPAANGAVPVQQVTQQAPTQPSNSQGRRKKKKKFSSAPSAPKPPRPEPGNSIAPMNQGKKKRQQRGPREFVGPMDHSYRVVNGNVADSPASTIPVYSNGGGNGYYTENYAPPSPPPTNAPARIFCFIEDLFFNAKINETSKKLGIKVEFIKGDKDGIARLIDNEEEVTPHLIVFDLNNVSAKPMTLIPKLKSKYKKAVSIIGFLSHIQGDLKLKAIEAGCDTVMPRSAFSQSLPNLLRRYGLDDEDDHYPQPM
jgi:hypothetical protein